MKKKNTIKKKHNLITARNKNQRWFVHPYFILFCRLALGGVLIFAGLSKIQDIETLILTIKDYDILPDNLTTFYGMVLPFLETVLGSFIVLGILLKVSVPVSGLLVTSFTIAKSSALVRGLDVDLCICFGPWVPLMAAQSLVVDFVLLALMVHIWRHRGGKLLSVDALLIGGKKLKVRK